HLPPSVGMKGAVLGFLYSFILFSFTSSMTLDLTELRNKVSKIKVNPRGNLWATGHFMGKKSVVDSSSMESSLEDHGQAENGAISSVHSHKDVQTVLLQLLNTPRYAQHRRSLQMSVTTILCVLPKLV
uniref:Neuromedin B n=1 Tax=Neogobius melanostomus TaxID=47308 RepID=A0A8C6WNF4_9GOBI